MPHEVLHCHQDNPLVYQALGEGVAQHVGRHALQLGELGILPDDVLDGSFRQAVLSLANEDVRVIDLRPLGGKVLLQRSPGAG